MNYFQERAALLQMTYSSDKDPISLYKQMISQKYLNRPKDFFEGQEFFNQFRQMSAVLEMEFNSLVVDLEAIGLRIVGRKFKDVYELMEIILSYITDRAVFFYRAYCQEKEKALSETGKNYCRGCRKSMIVEKFKKENLGITEISFGRLKTVREEIIDSQEESQQDNETCLRQDAIDKKKQYLYSLKISQTTNKLSQILEGSQKFIKDVHLKSERQCEDYDSCLSIAQFEQQRKRVKGMVEKRRSTIWNSPKMISSVSILKQDTGVQTLEWEFDHMRATLILEKQAVMKTLANERQRSEGYLHTIRKNKIVIDDQQKQLSQLQTKNREYLTTLQQVQEQKRQFVQKINDLETNNKMMRDNSLEWSKQKSKLKTQLIDLQMQCNKSKQQFQELIRKRIKVDISTQTMQNRSVVIKASQKLLLNTSSGLILNRNKQSQLQSQSCIKNEGQGLKSQYCKSQASLFRKTKNLSQEEIKNDNNAMLNNSQKPAIQHSSKPSIGMVNNKFQRDDDNHFQVQSSFVQNKGQKNENLVLSLQLNSVETSPIKSNLKNINLLERSNKKPRLSKTISTQNNQHFLNKPTIAQFSLKKLKKYNYRSRQNSPRRTNQNSFIIKQRPTQYQKQNKEVSPAQNQGRRKIIRNTTVVFPIRKSPCKNTHAYLSTQWNEEKVSEESVVLSSRAIIQIKKEDKGNIYQSFISKQALKDDKQNSTVIKQQQINKIKSRNRLKLDIKSYENYERITYKQWAQDLQNWFNNTKQNVITHEDTAIISLVKLIQQFQSFQKHHADKVTTLKAYLIRMNQNNFIAQYSKLSSTYFIIIIVRLYFAHQKCESKIKPSDSICKHLKQLTKILS